MTKRDDEWIRLYEDLRRTLNLLGTENAFGEADYWLVDDDYGDTTQKICVHQKSFLKPSLVAAIQKTLQLFPHWRVMLQIEFPVAGVADASCGVIIYANEVEEHWDRELLVEVATRLGL